MGLKVATYCVVWLTDHETPVGWRRSICSLVTTLRGFNILFDHRNLWIKPSCDPVDSAGAAFEFDFSIPVQPFPVGFGPSAFSFDGVPITYRLGNTSFGPELGSVAFTPSSASASLILPQFLVGFDYVVFHTCCTQLFTGPVSNPTLTTGVFPRAGSHEF